MYINIFDYKLTSNKSSISDCEIWSLVLNGRSLSFSLRSTITIEKSQRCIKSFEINVISSDEEYILPEILNAAENATYDITCKISNNL